MSADEPEHRRLLLAIIIVGYVLRLYFAIVTPIGGPSTAGVLSAYNDEIAHVNYTRYVIEQGGLPGNVESIAEPGALERGHFENYQPPLYYLTHAGIAAVFGLRESAALTYAGRLLSIVLSLGLLVIFGRFARRFHLSPAEYLTGLALLCLSPVFVRFTSVAGNDALFWVCAGGITWTSLRVADDDAGTSQWISLGLWLSLGFYTKLSALLLLPMSVVAVLVSGRRGRFTPLAATVVLALAASLPVWIRNVYEFGSIVPLASGFGAGEWGLPGSESFSYALRSSVFPWSEFWQSWTGAALMALPAAVIIFRCAGNCASVGSRVGPVLWSGLAVVILAFLWLNLRYEQSESRYLLAAWPVLILAISVAFQSRLWARMLAMLLLVPYTLFLL